MAGPNVLWAGTEPDAFDGTTAVSTSTTNYDANFSRAATSLGNASGGTTVLCGIDLGGLSTAWFHYRMGADGLNVDYSYVLIEFRNSSAQGILRVIGSGSTNLYRLQYWSGSTWTQIGSNFTLTPTNADTVDVGCHINGSTGRFECWVNGAQVALLTGNTDFFSATISRVRLSSWSRFNAKYVSECIIADASTVGMRLATLAFTATGAGNTWTSGTYTDIDESNVNDSDLMSSNTASQVYTFTLGDLSATAQLLVPVAVIASARVRNSATGPQNFDLAVRTGATNYFGTPTYPTISTSFQNAFQYVWQQNPNTTADWTVSEINGLEAGGQSVT